MVDLAAVRANVRRLRALAAPARLMAVVKADAYGLGAVPVARRLFAAGCRHVFTAHLSEAQAIRPLLPNPLPPGATLAVLNGLWPGDAPAYADAGIDLLLLQMSPQAEEMDRFAAQVIAPMREHSRTR